MDLQNLANESLEFICAKRKSSTHFYSTLNVLQKASFNFSKFSSSSKEVIHSAVSCSDLCVAFGAKDINEAQVLNAFSELV